MRQNSIPVETYKNAICLPCTGAESGPVIPGVKGGLYQADGRLIKESLLHRQHIPAKVRRNGDLRKTSADKAPIYPVQYPGEIGETKEVLNGSYIYAGLLFTHFGHFLLESLSRLWFIKQHPEIPIVWVAAHRQTKLNTFQKEIIELLKIKNTIYILTAQTEIEEIIVPKPGYMIESIFLPEQKQALKIFAPVPLQKGKKVWLSRRNVNNGRFLNESVLENYLNINGWSIYRPEEHSVRDQLLFLRDAEHIAGIAGTAHHLLLFLPDYQGKVSLFPRGTAINGDFMTIANILGLNQTVFFEDTVDCTPKLPSWMKDWCWTNLNAVLKRLGENSPLKNEFRKNITAVLTESPRSNKWRILLKMVARRILRDTKNRPSVTLAV